MPKTNFIQGNPNTKKIGTTILGTWLNKVFGVDGHVHNGVDDDGHVSDAHLVAEVIFFAGSSLPAGFLLCDGAAVSRTTYAALFAVIGINFGNGNGSTTFNLPGLRGRSPIGTGQGPSLTNRILGEKNGKEYHQLTEPEMPAHTHDLGRDERAKNGNVSVYEAGSTLFSTSTGGDQPHNNMQPFLAVNFAIKY